MIRSITAAGLMATAMLAAATPPALAQAPTAYCAELIGPIASMNAAMSAFLGVVSDVDMTDAMALFSGRELAAFEALEAARLQLVPAMAAYLDAAEDLGYLMQKCSR